MQQQHLRVIRFVTFHSEGFKMPIRKLILGHGYMEHGGLSHESLLKTYLGKEVCQDRAHTVYAGYLYVENDEVIIFSGGSQTLNIPESNENNEKLVADLGVLWKMKVATIHLYPLLAINDISHAMLAQQ